MFRWLYDLLKDMQKGENWGLVLAHMTPGVYFLSNIVFLYFFKKGSPLLF